MGCVALQLLRDRDEVDEMESWLGTDLVPWCGEKCLSSFPSGTLAPTGFFFVDCASWVCGHSLRLQSEVKCW